MVEDPTEIEIAWLAGYLEGEGYFVLNKTSPMIRFSSTDSDIVEKAARIMNSTTGIYECHDNDPKHKVWFNHQINGYDAFKWMKLIRPYMGIRRGAKIDKIIKDTLELRPFIGLGPGFCKRGHSIRYDYEYYLDSDGGRGCKMCQGQKVRRPPEKNGIKMESPFKKVG